MALTAAGVRPMAGMLAVKVRAYPPDRRKRDIDNIQKPLLDALEKGRAFFNDCQIKHLTTIMKEPLEGGKTIVTIRSMHDRTSTISKTSR
jgi:crossover junction endodeoxyribonuclease RusA